MSCEVWTIPVPGHFVVNVAFLDIETEKVATESFALPSGEPLRRRWAVTTIGVALNGRVEIVDGAEWSVLAAAGELLASHRGPVRYGATRQFDEMVLKGRFTNARRAHLPAPAFPAMPGADAMRWELIPATARAERATDDVPSRDVPAARKDGRWMAAMVHNLRDVAELILANGAPDAECAAWCRRVLLDSGFALDQFEATEPQGE